MLLRHRVTGPVPLLGLICATAALCLPAQAQSLREIRRISAASNDLSGVGAAVTGPDGVIWIYQPEDGTILGFTAGSATPQVVGHAGEGPGDLRDATQMFARPDELWVVDWILQRTTSFDASGRVKSSTRVSQPEGFTSPRLQAAAPTGGTWWQSFQDDGTTTVWAVPGNGGSRQPVLRALPRLCSLSRRTQKGSVGIAVPFCHRSQLAFSPNGEFAAEAVPLTLVDRSNGLQVVVVSVQGDTVLHRRLPLAASPIPGAIRDSAINYRLGRARGVLRELYQEMVDQDLVPRVYSPVVDLRVSDAGDVVLDVVEGRAAERHLVVLRRDGRAVVRLPMQATQSLRWFGGNRLLLTDEDEDGLEDVVLYEIVGSR